jgi:hypothetical protein
MHNKIVSKLQMDSPRQTELARGQEKLQSWYLQFCITKHPDVLVASLHSCDLTSKLQLSYSNSTVVSEAPYKYRDVLVARIVCRLVNNFNIADRAPPQRVTNSFKWYLVENHALLVRPMRF